MWEGVRQVRSALKKEVLRHFLTDFPTHGEGCGEHFSMNLDRGNLWSCFVISTQYTSCLVCKLQTNSFSSETRPSPAPALEKPPGDTAFFVLHPLVSWHFAFFLGQ